MEIQSITNYPRKCLNTKQSRITAFKSSPFNINFENPTEKEKKEIISNPSLRKNFKITKTEEIFLLTDGKYIIKKFTPKDKNAQLIECLKQEKQIVDKLKENEISNVALVLGAEQKWHFLDPETNSLYACYMLPESQSKLPLEVLTNEFKMGLILESANDITDMGFDHSREHYCFPHYSSDFIGPMPINMSPAFNTEDLQETISPIDKAFSNVGSNVDKEISEIFKKVAPESQQLSFKGNSPEESSLIPLEKCDFLSLDNIMVKPQGRTEIDQQINTNGKVGSRKIITNVILNPFENKSNITVDEVIIIESKKD